MEIVIDNREGKLIGKFEEKKETKFSVCQLDIGDFLIKRNDEVVIVIERKTLGDLYSSIHDGRYKEQKLRIKSNFKTHQIVYLIEGTMREYNKKYLKNFKSIVNGAVINTMYRDSIRCIKTSNLDESYDILLGLSKKIHKNPEFFSGEVTANKSVDIEEYISAIKIKKKENMTPKNCGILQLCHIPGVSKNMSICIIENYGSVRKIIEKLLEQPETERGSMLKSFMYKSSDSEPAKTRKIGPVVSNRIYEYLCS
jgi:ERCC4-type nuclease